ncbi:PP2C family protein-serine/threonine phosphatase [uncultured Friedmanniella sp.]|uniref:PP2C family protein-serine/threonine phosphatase n=1 Tax=uncultured Friedmanniella sp. TaxID=335381 RepID=UPI0035CAAF6E
MTLLLRFVTHSEIGLVRKNNQDSGYASPHLLLVADGMGGAAAGDLASAVAVEAIRQVDAETPGDQMLSVLAGAVADANDRLAALVGEDSSLDGMGTTVTGALFDGVELGLAHIGDSRAYLFREGRLEQLTHDHSWVQSLVDDGRIDPAEAASHPHRSLLLKVLNGQPGCEPDLTLVPVQAGDRLLFCSDGLCGLVPDADIAEALRGAQLDAVLATLVAAAHAEGGIDNITVILADVLEGQPVVPVDTVEAVVLGAAAERALPAVGSASAEAAEDAHHGDDELEAQGATAMGGGPPTTGREDEARYNPQAPRQRRLGRRLAGVLVLLLVVAVASGATYAWGRSQYFVGAAGEQVAIYQGLPEKVVVPLSRLYEVQPVTLAGLPSFYADQVRTGIEVSSLASARQTVAELTEAAKRCTAGAGVGTSPTPKPTTSTPPRSTPSPRSTPKPAPTVKASASPSASPTPTNSTKPSC